MTDNTRITEETYDRNTRHIEFDLGTTGFSYEVGDVLAVQAHNNPETVSRFLNDIKLSPNEIINIDKITSDKILEYPQPLSL